MEASNKQIITQKEGIHIHTNELNPPSLSAQESAKIMRTMLQSIELDKLLSDFHKMVAESLPCTSIKLSFAGQSIIAGVLMKNARSMKISLLYGKHKGMQQHAQLAYSFSSVLSAGQRQRLSEIHALCTLSLCHALDYYSVSQLATKDMLTGLANRMQFNESIVKLMSLSERNQHSFGLLVLDLDNFKSVNDTCGHSAGDEVLIAFAGVLRDCLRDSDYAFRFGGDEFCCLLSDCDVNANEYVANRIRQKIKQHPLFVRHAVSTSVGATHFVSGDTINSIFERADKALYSAKSSGKNMFRAA